jgi:hypothetical protein
VTHAVTLDSYGVRTVQGTNMAGSKHLEAERWCEVCSKRRSALCASWEVGFHMHLDGYFRHISKRCLRCMRSTNLEGFQKDFVLSYTIS